MIFRNPHLPRGFIVVKQQNNKLPQTSNTSMKLSEKQQELALEIVDETVDFYAEDPSRRAADPVDNSCCYRTEDGRRCAFGRVMKEDVLDTVDAPLTMAMKISRLVTHFATKKEGTGISHDDLLQKPYRGLPLHFWRAVQFLHDMESNWGVEGLTECGEKEARHLRRRIKQNTLHLDF